jgi:hypothetical protein
LNSISKLQTYLTKIDTLCQLIGNDNVNIDQALIMYQKQIEHDNDAIEKSNILLELALKYLLAYIVRKTALIRKSNL